MSSLLMMEEPQPVYTQVGTPSTSIIWSESDAIVHCRLCGNTNDYMIPIFSGEGLEHNMEYKINRFFPVKVSFNDRFPNQICYNCASTIIAFTTLVETSLEVEKKFYSCVPCDEKEKEESFEINKIYDITDTQFIDSELGCQQVKEIAHVVPSDVTGNMEISSHKDNDVIENEVVNERVKEQKKPRKRKKRSISTCLICGKVFNFLEYLKSHLLIHSENRPHLCHICGATFKRKDHVNHHRRTVHITHRDVIRELGAKGEEPLTCEICGDVKPTRHAMQVHKKKHNKVHVCDVCNKSFTLPSLVKEHMINDHSDELCTCNICGEVLKSGHSLYLHKKKHSTSYICDVCGKSFSLPSSLRTHMVVHSDEKPFTCDECGKSFKLRGRLQLHKKNHGNVRPYACNICENKRFKTKSALIVHNKMHNDTRLYPCPHCTFRARKNSDLVCHIRTHTGEKPYKCDICGRGFAQAGDMRKHRTTHNRQKVV